MFLFSSHGNFVAKMTLCKNKLGQRNLPGVHFFFAGKSFRSDEPKIWNRESIFLLFLYFLPPSFSFSKIIFFRRLPKMYKNYWLNKKKRFQRLRDTWRGATWQLKESLSWRDFSSNVCFHCIVENAKRSGCLKRRDVREPVKNVLADFAR